MNYGYHSTSCSLPADHRIAQTGSTSRRATGTTSSSRPACRDGFARRADSVRVPDPSDPGDVQAPDGDARFATCSTSRSSRSSTATDRRRRAYDRLRQDDARQIMAAATSTSRRSCSPRPMLKRWSNGERTGSERSLAARELWAWRDRRAAVHRAHRIVAPSAGHCNTRDRHNVTRLPRRSG